MILNDVKKKGGQVPSWYRSAVYSILAVLNEYYCIPKKKDSKRRLSVSQIYFYNKTNYTFISHNNDYTYIV